MVTNTIFLQICIGFHKTSLHSNTYALNGLPLIHPNCKPNQLIVAQFSLQFIISSVLGVQLLPFVCPKLCPFISHKSELFVHYGCMQLGVPLPQGVIVLLPLGVTQKVSHTVIRLITMLVLFTKSLLLGNLFYM